MIKRISTILISIFFLLALFCMVYKFLGTREGDISSVKIIDKNSLLYTQDEIQDAIDYILNYFKINFKDCTLKEISYIGDEINSDYEEYTIRYNKDKVIVLVSSFDVGSSGGDGSLNLNSEYTNWKWILVKDKNGCWEHVDHGY